jgi:hypothetical protein
MNKVIDVTPTLSLAEAEMLTVPLTVLPLVGVKLETTGAVRSELLIGGLTGFPFADAIAEDEASIRALEKPDDITRGTFARILGSSGAKPNVLVDCASCTLEFTSLVFF